MFDDIIGKIINSSELDEFNEIRSKVYMIIDMHKFEPCDVITRNSIYCILENYLDAIVIIHKIDSYTLDVLLTTGLDNKIYINIWVKQGQNQRSIRYTLGG